MQYRNVGASGLKVPAISFGTGTFGGQGPLFSAWGRSGAAEGEGAPPETERVLRSPEHRDRARAHLTERKVFALLREKARLKMAVA